MQGGGESTLPPYGACPHQAKAEPLAKYLATRLILVIPTLFLLSILVFGAIRIIPGDVCRLILQSAGTQEAVDEETCKSINAALGLDKPAPTQYVSWMGNVLTGDLGKSLFNRRDVLNDIKLRMAVTLELALLGASFSLLVGVPMGVASALKQNKFQDYALRFVAVGWLSVPSFWVATLLVTLPAIWWNYAPPVGYTNIWDDPIRNIQQMYLPVLAIGLGISAAMARLTRSSMLEVLREDYVRTARAKGLANTTVIYRHALRNALMPVVTLFGFQTALLLSGAVIIELIFGLPGIGSFLLDSVQLKDYPAIQGAVLFFAVVVVLVNLAVDMTYGLLDPRVRRY
jgi:peptide/nickel transport system permease protein